MKRKVLPLLMLVAISIGARAQTDRELDQLLQRLEQLSERRTQDKEVALRRVLPDVQKAASSGPNAVSAFTEAYRNIELAGRTAQASDFQSWRESNRDVLNSNEFRAAAQLHAEYLAITLQRAASDEPLDFVQPSFNYLSKLADAWSKVFSRQDKPSQLQNQLLRGNIREGLMAKNWDLAAFLPDMRDWEFSPGNAEGILEKNIRPFLREKKDKRIVDTWDWQMKFEESQFAPRDRSHAFEMFHARRLPELKMNQARDRAAQGDNVRAARDAVAVLTQHPEHPSFDQWVDNIRKWLEEARKQPAETTPEDTTPPAEEEPAQQE